MNVFLDPLEKNKSHSFFSFRNDESSNIHNIVKVKFLKINADILNTEEYYEVSTVRGWIFKYLRQGNKKRLFSQMKRIRGRWEAETFDNATYI